MLEDGRQRATSQQGLTPTLYSIGSLMSGNCELFLEK